MTADIAFEQCVNKAAVAFSSSPPYLSYRVATRVSVPSFHRRQQIERLILVRTRDNVAVMHDVPGGRERVGQAQPIIGAFDPFAAFTFSYPGYPREPIVTFSQGQLWHFDLPAADPAISAVSPYLSRWYPVYAPDSNASPGGVTHISIEPVGDWARNDLIPRELYIENASGLPQRVELRAPRSSLVVEFRIVEGHWLVSHGTYEETQTIPLGRVHVIVDSSYDQYSFPATVSDPRLQ